VYKEGVTVYSSKEGTGEEGKREKDESSVIDWLTNDEQHKKSVIYMNKRRSRTERKRETEKER